MKELAKDLDLVARSQATVNDVDNQGTLITTSSSTCTPSLANSLEWSPLPELICPSVRPPCPWSLMMPSDKGTWKCCHCAATYDTCGKRRAHVDTHHRASVTHKSPDGSIHVVHRDEDDKMTCDQCGRQYLGGRSLLRHVRNCNGTEAPQPGVVSNHDSASDPNLMTGETI